MTITSRSDNGILFRRHERADVRQSRARSPGTPIEEHWDADVYGDKEVSELYKGKPHEWHKANFFRCIQEGGLPVSDVPSHVQAMNVCHLAVIAARLGRTITWDPVAEQILGDEEAASFFARTPRPEFEIPRV